MTQKDRRILRELADRYYEIALSDENLQHIQMHKRVNDLKPSRPIVLIDEIPWNEMDIDGELTMACEEPECHGLEFYFRNTLYRWKHMRADMVVRPFVPVNKVIYSTGIGVARQEKEHEENAASHTYVDQFETEADLEKLHFEQITYDQEATERQYEKIAGWIGDILPVKIAGESVGYGFSCKTMDDIVNLRGLDTFFYDFIERPEFMHKLIGKLTDIYMDKVRQYDEMGLFEADAYDNHSASALTNDLHPDRTHVRAKDVWGRGLAQIFASVSPQMHDEFDIQYMKKALAPFGLVYYGCCEPLDKKIDILRQIPNLRKISITPWADVHVAAESIGRDYVISSKPNPSHLATDVLQEDAVRQELSNILDALKQNGCSADIVLKDITTVHGRPENLFRWTQIAMELVNTY